MTNNMMTVKSKAMLGKREITVTQHFPEGQKTIDMIADKLAEFRLSYLRKFYTDDELSVLLPIFEPLVLKAKELRKQNYKEEDIDKIISNELQQEMKKKSEAEQKNIKAAIYYSNQRQLIREGKSNNGE